MTAISSSLHPLDIQSDQKERKKNELGDKRVPYHDLVHFKCAS